MIRKTITTILVSLFWLVSLAQNNQDSLWSIWNDTQQYDTVRIKALDQYINATYIPDQPDSAIYLAEKQLQMAESKGYIPGQVSALQQLSSTSLKNLSSIIMRAQHGL